MTFNERIEELVRLYNDACDRHNYRLANTIRGWILGLINDSINPDTEYTDEQLGQGRR